jgi:uncharacterized membrane protein YqaE (UPF0057 family)
MKSIRILAILFFALAINIQVNASNKVKSEKKTAESVMAFAKNMKTFDAEVLKAEMMQLSRAERVKLIRMAIKDVKMAEASGAANPSVGLYILAVLIPPLAVGIYTNWGMPTLYNLLWTLLFWFPGVIHAFIVFGR